MRRSRAGRCPPWFRSSNRSRSAAPPPASASSPPRFRYGLVHETIVAIDVLTGGGSIVTCTAGQRASRPFLRVSQFLRYAGLCAQAHCEDAFREAARPPGTCSAPRRGRFFEHLAAHCGGTADFVDGVVFSGEEISSSASVASPMKRPCRAITLSSTSITAPFARSRSTTSGCATTSGAGTPTGSGARRTSLPSTRWRVASTAANA